MVDDVGDRRGWHIDKGIPIAAILALTGIAYGAMQRLSEQDERIGKVELSVQYIQQTRTIDQGRTEKKFDELKTDLRTINGKLDRIIESDR